MMPHHRIHRFWFTPSKLEPPADYSGRRSKRNLQKGNRWEDCVDSDPFLGDCGTRRMAPPSACQPPPRPEDIRFQALLNERLWALNRERHGLWSKIWRYLWGGRRMC